MGYYEQRAMLYAERYGIVAYDVVGNKMIYYKSYQAYINNPRYTVKFVVNLDTMQSSGGIILKRYNKKGELNV